MSGRTATDDDVVAYQQQRDLEHGKSGESLDPRTEADRLRSDEAAGDAMESDRLRKRPPVGSSGD